MNEKRYSHILDVVAGDQVPGDLDLAPNILTRIQKKKGIPMQPRTRVITAATLAAIVLLIVLFSTVPGLAEAVGRWFGYVPGVGFVREGQIRTLAGPVSLTREGVTVTVEQVVLDPERTALVYSVEGIPSAAIVTNPEEQRCAYKVSLRLPDGSPLLATPEGIQFWASGYQHRFNYSPLPSTVNSATLVIDCLFNTRAGAAPENWEIPLSFIPAPADMTAFPVIEIPTQAAPAATQPPEGNEAAAATAPAQEPAAANPARIDLTLDRAVQMDDGYLIYATLHWKDTPFAMVVVADPMQALHLLDANGKEMRYELHYDEQVGVNIDQRQTTLAIKTEPVQTPGPLTLVIDFVSTNLQTDGTFVFDPGPAPKSGQTWALDQDVEIGEYTLHVHSAIMENGGYNFEMSSENGILNAALVDMEHPIAGGGGGGGGGNPGETFFSGFTYADGLPDGPVTITVSAIEVKLIQRLEAQWTPPAASANQLPTQAAACLTVETWKTALTQQQPLPDGLSGLVLTGGLLDGDSGEWGLTLSSPDGVEQQVIKGAQDGSFSPDGSRLAYSTTNNGIWILDLSTGQTTAVPGTGNGDFNPMWSPDGKQFVFNRGMGIFDLFLVQPDGENLRQITHGGVQEWPVGWLPDGQHLLYTVPGRENEYTVYKVDVQSGESEMTSSLNTQSLSPDSSHILTSEKTFGDRWLVYISDMDGANRWLLNDSNLWVMTPVWSPDGQWLIAAVADTEPASAIGALIDLRTCQVFPLPHLRGNILAWTP